MTTFPQAPLGVKVELDLASTWTDITHYAMQREGTSPPISITRGRPDESAQVNPSTAAMQWNNRDGRFTVLNATGPYYGQLTRNAPVRISVPAQNTYLRLENDAVSYVSCPDAAGLDITGDIEIQIDMWPASYVFSTLASKSNPAGTHAWLVQLLSDGTLRFFWSADGSTLLQAVSTLPVPVGRVAVKVTLAVATSTVTFYTAPTIGGSWTQLGSAVSTGASTSVFNSNAAVVVGDNSTCIQGQVYGFKLLNGIGGTVKASPDFTAQTAGAGSFADAQSNTWTLAGTAELSNRSYRYHGETSSLPVTWDTSGKDIWVPVAAGGLLRRIGQGNAPLYSAMKRAVLSQTGTLAPVAYWPCEDLSGASTIGSATGGPAMSIIGGTGNGSTTTTGPGFAADSSFPCSLALPQANGSSWIGQVPAYTSNGSIVVRFLMNVQTAPAVGARIIRVIATGTCEEFSLYYGGVSGSTLEFGMAGYDSSGANVFDSTATIVTGLTASEPVWVSMELRPSGGNVNYAAVFLQPGQSTGQAINGSFAGTAGNATSVYTDPFQNLTAVTIGHISVQSDWVSLFSLYNPLNAWQGELAGNRFARLCAENGYTSRIYGPPGTTVAMGAQSPNTLTTLLQEIEEADHGQIFEPRQILGLGYRTQAALLQQAPAVTIDYSAAELAGADLQPTYDDQFTRNDVTVQRSSGATSGSSYRYELNDGTALSVSAPPAGVGDYSDSKSVNVQFDAQLPDQAGWLVHIGTVNEARWPHLPLNMARTAVSGIFYAILAADIGDYVQVINLPAWLPPDPVKQLILGTKEELGGFHYLIEWQAVPESVYEVAIYDDAVYGRADTDGSTLASSATTTATSLSVASTNTALPLWTTVAADFPFDIAVAGERMTVTNITGSSSPQTFTVTRSVNGVVKAQASGADVRLWFPPIYAML